MKEKLISSYLIQLLIRYVKEKRDNEFEQALVRVLIGLVLIYYFNDLRFAHPQALSDLEHVSKDKTFLDDLIIEFIYENKKSIVLLEKSLLAGNQEKVKDIVHSIKGSALSIGAVSLKMMCRRVEKLGKTELETYPEEILQQFRHAFGLLCEQLEEYRQKRLELMEST
jgi:HPt (histidine-containing phosphotransfer) domain-containing protein